MHSRRQFLVSSVALGTSAVGGCLNAQNSSSPPDAGTEETGGNGIDDTDDSSRPTARAEWAESIVQGRQYQVTITPEFENIDTVRVENTDEDVLTTIPASKSGSEVAVAGPSTSYGLAENGEMFRAVYTTDAGFDSSFSLHMVGSKQQPDSIPLHLDGIQGGTGEDLRKGGTVEREFTYDVFGGRYRYTSHVPQNLIDHYERRTRIDEYGAYVSDPFHENYIQDMADAFVEGADSERRAIEHARAFVQQLEYTRDRVSQGTDEYPQFPVETMYAQRGDCEDTAILLSAIYRQLGYGSVLIALWDAEHMALGIKGSDSLPGTYYEYGGSRYYYVETTASGWEIGQMPDDIHQTEAEILPVNAYPSLVFAWGTTAGRDGVTVEMAVNNRGQVMATNVRVIAEFETRSGRTVAQDYDRIRTVSPGAIEERTLQLDPPTDETVRGRFALAIDGKLYDEATTDWRDPLEL